MNFNLKYNASTVYADMDPKTMGPKMMGQQDEDKQGYNLCNAYGLHTNSVQENAYDIDYSDINFDKASVPETDPSSSMAIVTEGNSKKPSVLLRTCTIIVATSILLLVALVISTSVGFAQVSQLKHELILAKTNKSIDKQVNESSMPTTTITPENEAVNYTYLFSMLQNPYSKWINILTNNTVLTETLKNCVEGKLFGNSSLTLCIDFVAHNYGTRESIPAASCEEIHIIQPANSGYYWVTSSNGSSIRVYCEMTLTCANKTGGLTRAFILNPQYCTGDVKFDATGCVRISPEPGCSEISFLLPTNIPFSNVCGNVRGSWFGYPDGYSGRPSHTTINDNYVDGISFTYNISSHRNHLWTFSATQRNNCSQNIPEFVERHTSCFGNTSITSNYSIFARQFQQPVPDSIEVRLCQDNHRDRDDGDGKEGVYLQNLEIYVW